MAKSKSKKEEKSKERQSDSFLSRNIYRIVVFCFSFLLYVNTIPNDYNLDDELVTINHKLTSHGIQAIPEIFSSPYYSDDMGYAFEYRPMVHATFAIEHQLFGESSHVSHFINALLYAGLCWLLFIVLSLLFRGESNYLSLLVTLVFAAHPVHTEVVASIKNRDEMLALFFSLASWYFILKYSKEKFVWAIVGGSIFFLMALLSKISVFSFVVTIPLSLLFFRKLSLYKTLVVLTALFIPAFLIINIMDPVFKLLLFGVICGVLYLAYVFVLLLQKVRRDSRYITALTDLKSVLTREVFPFNHRLFFPGLFTVLILSLAGSMFLFAKTGNYYGIIILSGFCLLLSLKAQGIFRWLLLFAFQLSSVFMHYFVSEQFAIVILLSWCFFALQFVKSQTKEDKWIFGSLLILSVPFSFLIHIYPYRSYLFTIAVSLIPFFYTPAKKYAKYFLYILSTILLVGILGDLIRGRSYPFLLPLITILYLLLAYLSEKLRVKKEWLFVLLFFSHLFFAFNARINWNYMLQIPALYSKFSETTPRLPQISDSSNAQQPTGQTPDNAKNNVSNLAITILPEKVTQTVNRPLDFVENPVTAKDPLPMKMASALDVMLRYLKLLVIPYPLSYYYGYKIIEPVKLSSAMVVFSILIHLTLLLLALYFFRQNKLIPLFGILFYFITILQFTNIFQAVPGMMADRYLLSPSLGFCVLIGYLLIRLLKLENANALSQIPKNAKGVIIVLLLLYSGLTIARNSDWKDNLTLFRNDIKHLDQSAQAHNLLGLNLLVSTASMDNDKIQQNQIREEAIMHFKRALEIYPQFFNVAYDLGRAYTVANQGDSALVYFHLALQLDSTFSEVPINIGEIYYYQQRYLEAIPYFERAMNQDLNFYKAYDKLSYVFFTIKQYDKALEVNKLAMQRMPALLDPLVNIGRTFQTMNQADSARFYFEKALVLSPGNPTVVQLLQQTGNVPK